MPGFHNETTASNVACSVWDVWAQTPHIRSDEYRNLLLILELALKRLEISFGSISGSTAIETIEKAEILLVERGPYVSYANCGLPYHVGG